MRSIHAVLTGYLAGRTSSDVVADFPHAARFIRRTYDWLGPSSQLTEVQRLMLERMLFVVEYLGEQRTPLKQWLTACLWHNLTYAPIDRAHPAGLIRHRDLLDHAARLGVSVREWMNSALRSGASDTRAQT